MDPLYVVPLVALGVVPSTVYLIVALGVVQLMATLAEFR
jgi:hypothetical protein